MSTIGSFEGFQPVSLKQEGEDPPSETEHLSVEEEDPGNGQMPRQISRQSSEIKATLYPNPYHKLYISRTYFVTRPGAIETAMEDLKGHISEVAGETIQGFWLLTQIDHWNNEKERILLVTDKTLFICKYDFIMLSCVQRQQIPLSAIHRICLGKFAFPKMSLDKRPGEGIRIYWGSSEEQSLLSRWNPWSTEVPYATFTEHPMIYTSEKFLKICKLTGFMSKLVPAIQNAQKNSRGSGREKELTVLTQPILIETYTGLMSFIGNRNKLGYSLARGSIGF
ncbi:PREDICTED: tumor protein p63-regulated gene 1 protein [Chinchilla lanigera]|uniref:Tumor protein p63 regulated 1 n=1 Tax=Chinchilla lanigera TaxID=34839 RepID=A0A8C2VR17_CHILA|nr:PREDICTED: tumor protein p63-regulated gene 1 protein [Chinchilla lanigera]XP_013369079.1 PREDICTED: tumor protein p63-regulated gene 1 protein [Chinchilla lanigera]XP_013369080.1 PREDICTED: tumor protein p63-regulated gene 1 protein [Chinchilla lanigera]